jgi:hypothetical protein
MGAFAPVRFGPEAEATGAASWRRQRRLRLAILRTSFMSGS